SVLKNGRFMNFSRENGLITKSVRVIYHDRDGGHWIGTYGGGLDRLKNGRMTLITTKNGLFNDVVFSIVEDDAGYLWMTCNFGVYRVSKKELDDFADGKTGSVHSTSFDTGDGMRAAECNGGFPGSWKGKDGRLYFPTIKGIAVIDPSHVAFNAVAPVVINEEVLLDGRQVDARNGLSAGPGRHNLEIHYTALSFIAPKDVVFRYRLKGFSDEWIHAGNRRTAFYTNVPPGDYTFEVMGSNNDGVWSRVSNPLRLTFQAAFFQTWWFVVACILGLLFVIWAGLKMRLRILEDHERQLVKRVSEQTAELTVARDAAETLAQINADAGRSSALILNSVTDGIIGLDVTGRPTFLNPAAGRIIGRSLADFKGMTLHDAIHHTRFDGTPFSQDDCVGTVAMRRRESIMAQDLFWRADGSSFPAEYSTIPVHDSEDGTALVMTFRDVTERRAIERLKDEFVSTVSHELRTPLTSIRGALGLLKSGMLGTIEAKGQRMLEIAVSNTDRLVRLINDILDLERIASGKIELSRSLVDAYELMTSAAEGVQSLAQGAGVGIAIEPVKASLWIDSDRITQTLTNLISNSIKFSPRGTRVSLSGEEREGIFTFRVADQGRGVPDDKLETIFERFKQVDASDSRDKGGSGLGLAISRSIVNAHGGKIWAERNGENGTVFQFTLPCRPIMTLAPIAPDVRQRILLCHDDRALTSTMTTILQNHGFDVAPVSAADEVATRAAEVRPAAIILDVAGGGRGREIVESLKGHAQTRETPIVVIAGGRPQSGESHAAAIASWVEPETPIHAVEVACAGPAILIVEDDLDLARVMIASLQTHGIRTIHAATGSEAIDQCREQTPTLIVLDLILPEVDGFAVVKALRENATLATIPLLVYSGREVDTAEQARLTLGPTDFLTKSRGSIEEFESRVVRLLETVIAREKGRDAA
ncbi:MAG: ATP-binding protein, partial [Thermoanaerobaculia bacterium]